MPGIDQPRGLEPVATLLYQLHFHPDRSSNLQSARLIPHEPPYLLTLAPHTVVVDRRGIKVRSLCD